MLTNTLSPCRSEKDKSSTVSKLVSEEPYRFRRGVFRVWIIHILHKSYEFRQPQDYPNLFQAIPRREQLEIHKILEFLIRLLNMKHGETLFPPDLEGKFFYIREPLC